MVLATIAQQRYLPNEIVVSEDGNFGPNAAVVAKWAGRLSVPLRHLKQRDDGNRKPLALNKAILASTGDYLIFVDGDCLLRSDFVQAHLRRANESAFLTGRRVELSPRATESLTQNEIESGYLNGFPWRMYRDAIFGETRTLGRFFRTPFFLRELFRQNQIDDIRGCNFSVHKSALEKINGFGNDFSGAYGEDSDVEYRLKFLGLEMRSVKGDAIQFHMWHPSQTKDLANQTRLQNLLKLADPVTKNGLREAASVL